MGGDTANSNLLDQRQQQQGVSVNVRSSNGSKFTVQIPLESTVTSFKSVVAQNCDIPADQQRLIYKGRILKDDLTLLSYGLEADHTVHLVRGFASSALSNTAAGTTNPAAPTATPGTGGTNSTERGSLGGSGFGDSLFDGLGANGLGGSGGLFGAALPDFDQVQQQLAQNPNVMREIMNMPLFQNIMNNPDVLRNMVMNNPQMREIIDRNPELGHILNDPSILRQTLEATRNPELMREMMRNTDRAMSNIESSPEGFNMLRRMYETVQEPLLNATTMGRNTENDTANPFAALLGTQGGGLATAGSTNTINNNETAGDPPAPNTNPLPNPWASGGTGGRGQTNTQINSTGSNQDRDVRPPAPAGLAGLGLPGLEGMLGAAPDTNALNQLMQNPAISQMMQSMLSNPQQMNQMFNHNPQLQTILDSNPQLREMLQNPEFLRQLMSPETLQQMLALQQSLPALGRLNSNPSQGQTGTDTGGMNNASLATLMNMFGGLGTGGAAVPVQPNVPPEELYATQLSQLQEMGFFDTHENLRALVATAGNVHAAVERLLGNSGQ